jgi:RNA polymerase sigma-70 factor (ECF subfamily)
VSGYQERLRVLFDTHEDKLYRLARRLTNSAPDAEDLLQDTFLKAGRALTSIPTGAANEEAWLTRVLVNTCRDQWRRAGVRRRAVALLRSDDKALCSDAESVLITKRIVWAALDNLGPRRRAVVVFAELDGKSVDEIARLLGCKVMTVRWHLSMARRELRRALAPYMERSQCRH